jgi:predicted DCC family thiol-disulfide oxidoreductase YuxK
VLVYDGACGVCTTFASWVTGRLRPDCEVTPWQEADLEALGLTREECERAVQWVRVDGRHDAGHRAIGQLLRLSGGPWPALGWPMLVPPTSWVAAGVYRLVAANRSRIPLG